MSASWCELLVDSEAEYGALEVIAPYSPVNASWCEWAHGVNGSWCPLFRSEAE